MELTLQAQLHRSLHPGGVLPGQPYMWATGHAQLTVPMQEQQTGDDAIDAVLQLMGE